MLSFECWVLSWASFLDSVFVKSVVISKRSHVFMTSSTLENGYNAIDPGEQARMSPAIAAVLVINAVLSLLCWWGVWRLLVVGRQMSRWIDELDAAESQIKTLLHEASEQVRSPIIELRTTQRRVQQLYQRVQMVIARLQQLRQVLRLIGMVLGWWRSRGFFSRS